MKYSTVSMCRLLAATLSLTAQAAAEKPRCTAHSQIEIKHGTGHGSNQVEARRAAQTSCDQEQSKSEYSSRCKVTTCQEGQRSGYDCSWELWADASFDGYDYNFSVRDRHSVAMPVSRYNRFHPLKNGFVALTENSNNQYKLIFVDSQGKVLSEQLVDRYPQLEKRAEFSDGTVLVPIHRSQYEYDLLFIDKTGARPIHKVSRQKQVSGLTATTAGDRVVSLEGSCNYSSECLSQLVAYSSDGKEILRSASFDFKDYSKNGHLYPGPGAHEVYMAVTNHQVYRWSGELNGAFESTSYGADSFSYNPRTLGIKADRTALVIHEYTRSATLFSLDLYLNATRVMDIPLTTAEWDDDRVFEILTDSQAQVQASMEYARSKNRSSNAYMQLNFFKADGSLHKSSQIDHPPAYEAPGMSALKNRRTLLWGRDSDEYGWARIYTQKGRIEGSLPATAPFQWIIEESENVFLALYQDYERKRDPQYQYMWVRMEPSSITCHYEPETKK